ncbi:uncharacterized protein LOC129778893 [Toxorhynchites rutilus septentrionalis]|uniref:uncharacterized protein LOC129778893 n=1 Tax=Toxorhynchites rutilus septentrionalis TaxID=329112 RepID=UPI002478FDEE|nr:uncharacterized protein LOC129778893 [Toxorhynchites rutilus septentrionalis]
MAKALPEVPNNNPTRFCRLCFSEKSIHWVIRTSGTEVDKPFIRTIGDCLGIWLTLDEDFPCAVCRACSATLEKIVEFREQCRKCDAALRKKRHEEPNAMVMFYDYPEGRVFMNGKAQPSSVRNDPDFELEPAGQNKQQPRPLKQANPLQPNKDRSLLKSKKAKELKRYFESYAIWKTKLMASKDDDEMTVVAPEATEHLTNKVKRDSGRSTAQTLMRRNLLDRTKCCLCKRECRTAASLKKHFQAKHRKLQCPKCAGRTFGSYSLLMQHMMRHQSDHWLLSCEKCGIQFVTVQEYESHRKNKDCWDQALMCECEHCGRKFSRRGRYIFHLKRLHPDKPLPPDLADDMQPRSSAKGGTVYTDTRQFQADSNSRPIVQRGRFVVMLEPLPSIFPDVENPEDSGRESPGSVSTTSATKEFPNTLVCTLCFEQFDGKASFNHHLQDCWGSDNYPKTSRPPYELCGCTVCGAIYERIGQFAEHFQRHERPYEVKLHDCPCCQRASPEPSERPDSPAAILGD